MGKKASISLGLVMLVAVFLVVGLTGTAFAAQPANVGDPLGTGLAAQEIQMVTLDPWVSGVNFTLSDGTSTTPVISFGDDWATIIHTTFPNVAAASPGWGQIKLAWTVNGPQPLMILAGTASVGPTAGVVRVTPGNLGIDVSPHGGYSDQTDYCLQCHKQHGSYTDSSFSTGAYALLRSYSVTETCNTCHSIYNQGGTSAFDPGITGLTIGTTAQRAVYENGQPANHASLDETSCAALVGSAKPANCTFPAVPKAETAGTYGHKIGYGMSAASLGTGSPVNSTTRYTSGWQFSWNYIPQTSAPANSTTKSGPGTASRIAGGFYCASCHTPHGADLGYAVNTEKGHASSASTVVSGTVTSANWNDGNIINWHNTTGATAAGVANNGFGNVYLQKVGGALNTGWNVCQTPGTNCVPATVSNAKGEQVSLYAYQLLTYANHQYQGQAPRTNNNLCSNGLPGSQNPATTADCQAIYGAGVTGGYTNTIPAPKTYGATAYGHDKAQWCGQCHYYAVDSTLGGTTHAHPTGCDSCHGNTPASISSPGGANGYPDFPHTSKEEAMLQELPDALCITCHTNLP